MSASAEKGRLLTGWLVERLVSILDEEFSKHEMPAGEGNGERESSRA